MGYEKLAVQAKLQGCKPPRRRAMDSQCTGKAGNVKGTRLIKKTFFIGTQDNQNKQPTK